jgi:hypothetical protein
MIPQKTKLSKLEEIKDISTSAIFYGINGIVYGINEVIQQGKHCYYHLTNQGHKVVERGEVDPDCFFDSFKMYVTNETHLEIF